MNTRPEDHENNKFADSLLLPIFAVAAVFLFVILCFYAYNHYNKNKNADGVIVLEGASEDFKTAPSDPGGMEVAHTDKEVFNTVTGVQEDIEGEQVNVVESEAPVSKEEIAASSEGTTPTIQVPSEGESSTVTFTPSEEDAAPAVAEDAAPSETPVSEDEKLAMAAEEAARNAAASAAAAQKEAVKVAEAPKEEPKKVEAPQKTIEAEVKKETNAAGESKTVVMFKDKPKSMGGGSNPAASSTSSSAPAKGAYYVQVSSHTTKSEAETAWSKLASKYSADVKGSSKNIMEADVRGKTYYRLSFGPFMDRNAASTKCGILKTKGQDCIIQRY